jgi:hypothetical protein
MAAEFDGLKKLNGEIMAKTAGGKRRLAPPLPVPDPDSSSRILAWSPGNRPKQGLASRLVVFRRGFNSESGLIRFCTWHAGCPVTHAANQPRNLCPKCGELCPPV